MPKQRSTLICLGLFLLLTSAPIAHAQWNPPNPVTSFEKQADGMVFTLRSGVLRLQVCSESIVHVIYSPSGTLPTRKDNVVIKSDWAATPWTMESTDKDVSIRTSRMIATVNRSTGAIAYSDVAGEKLVEEASRTLTPAKVNGEDTYRAESWLSMYGSEEALYGLGQHQAGVWNYRGASVDLSQENTEIAVPLLVSSKGYGVFWNNTSRSRVTTALSIPSTSARKLPTPSTITFFTAPISTGSSRAIAN